MSLQRGVFAGSEFHHPEAYDLYGRVEEEAYAIEPVYYSGEQLANGGGRGNSSAPRDMPPVAILLGGRLEDLENTQLALSVAERLLACDVPISWCVTHGDPSCLTVHAPTPFFVQLTLMVHREWRRRSKSGGAFKMHFQFDKPPALPPRPDASRYSSDKSVAPPKYEYSVPEVLVARTPRRVARAFASSRPALSFPETTNLPLEAGMRIQRSQPPLLTGA